MDVMQTTVEPTRDAALAALARVRPAAYARSRNHLEGAVTGLSPWLTHGLLTLPEVLAAVLRQGPLDIGHTLVRELGWRVWFRHVWAQRGSGILQSLHPGPRPQAETDDPRTLPDDIRCGRTGVPAIDQAVHTLYATGTLHNHARLWLASYVVHLRHLHWRAGADWMLGHLLDGDLASNHLSWQWVAGTGSHKPYLFNADNVARHAPAAWHSPGSVIDRPYEALEQIARHGPPVGGDGARRSWRRGPQAAAMMAGTMSATTAAAALGPPPLLTQPPADLPLADVPAEAAARLRGRRVWLVHPWALRAPDANGLGRGTRAGPASASDAAIGTPGTTAAVVTAGTPDTAASAPLPQDETPLIIGVWPREHTLAWPWSERRWRWVHAAMRGVTDEIWFTDRTGLARALQGAAEVRSVADPHVTPWLQGLAALQPEPLLFPAVDTPCQSWSQWWSRATRGLKQAGELL
jgi:deoxyribodipyrimidine photo-lyase